MIRVTRYREATEPPPETETENSQMVVERVEPHRYTVAGQTLVFEDQVASLALFDQTLASDQDRVRLEEPYIIEGDPHMVFHRRNAKRYYQGQAKFDNSECDVVYWRRRGVSQIDINGEPICQVDFAKQRIHLLNDLSFDNRINLEVVTGPALVLLLAEQDIYCLHAGAVNTVAGNVAFIAESGSGKSTLAASVDKNWRQLSDDILPLQLNKPERIVELFTSFPQLKLDGASVFEPIAAPQKLDFIVHITSQPSTEIVFKELSRADGLLQVIRHTVAARLFGQTLMKRHAKFSKRVSGRVPVIELSYPRNITQLDDLRIAIVDYLNAKSRATKGK